MGVEIERKFLVHGAPWEGVAGRPLVQGYLAEQDGVVVRVRVDGPGGWLTVKGPTKGASRVEVEAPIPLDEARQLLALCGPRVVSKARHEVEVQGHVWEIDVFDGLNAGLVVAEVELDRPDEPFVRPSWLGAEVTDDGRYTNVRLADAPFSSWSTR